MKRWLLLFIILLLLPCNLWAAAAACSTAGGGAGICYVDMSCATPGNGISQTCSGATAPFQHLAEVSALTYAGGDQILLKRGETWKERFELSPTKVGSGAAGNPIIIGAYGTGVNPIIDPSLLNPAWTSESYAIDATPDDTQTFETGNFDGAWYASASGADDAVVFHTGAHSRKFTNNQFSFATHTATYLKLKFQFLLSSASDAGENEKNYLARIDVSSSGVNALWIYYKDGAYWLDISNNTTMAKTFEVTEDTWYEVEYIFISGAGTGSAELKVDGVSKKTLSAQTYGTSNRYLFGNIASSGTSFIHNIDDLAATTTAPATYTVYYTEYTNAAHGIWNGTTTLLQKYTKNGLATTNTFFVDTVNLRNYVRLAAEADPSTQTMYVGNLYYPILLNEVSDITIDGLTIMHDGSPFSGNIYFAAAKTNERITIKNCDISYAAGNGILLGGVVNSITIEYNTIHHNGAGYGAGADYTTSAGAGITSPGATESGGTALTPIIIRYNEIYNNIPREGIALGRAEQAGIAYIKIYNNYVHDNGDIFYVYQGGGIGAGSIYCDIYNNLVTNTSGVNGNGAGIVVDLNSAYVNVYDNIVTGNDVAGISIYAGDHINVYNNTLYNNQVNRGAYAGVMKAEIRLYEGAGDINQNINIKNNIAYAAGTTNLFYVQAETTDNDGLVFDYNLWYGGGATPFTWGATSYSFANYKTNSSQDAHSLNVDPLFVSAATGDFRLKAGSPAINAGVDVSLTSDYAGKAVPIGPLPDMGAYEWSGSGGGLSMVPSGGAPFFTEIPK